MVVCPKCGYQYNRRTKRCHSCGYIFNAEDGYDNGNIIYFFVGLFFPILGFIVYLSWRDKHRQDARYAIIGTLIPVGIVVAGFLISILISFIYTISSAM